MMPSLILLTSPEWPALDQPLQKLASFLGLACIEMEVKHFLDAKPVGGGDVLAVHSNTLKSAFTNRVVEAQAVQLLFSNVGKVFVYGFTNAPEDARLLRLITGGSLSGVEEVRDDVKRYMFSQTLVQYRVPLAGMECEIVHPSKAYTFVETTSTPGLTILVSLNGKPLLATVTMAQVQYFFLAGSEIADIDALLPPTFTMQDVYPALLPAMIFFRTAFPGACWSNPSPSANIIIDDPMIRQRYGFVEYVPLLSEAKMNGYAVTIGFIPFNCTRSDLRVVGMLRGHLDRFSLAIHGCDHTWGEFGTLNETLSMHKVRLALARMNRHQQLTSLPFDPVMIFPQGIFATVGMRVLKLSGYLAAVNTEAHPVDSDQQPLALRHLLDGAVMAYHSFPLFLRRYPRPGSVFDYAVDLLLGKPVLIVEHHGYFKAGYAHLASLVRGINRLDERLRWVPLGQALTSHALFRSLGPERCAVRFFTPTFRLRNQAATRVNFKLEKAEADGEGVAHVTVNGQYVDFTVVSGMLTFELDLAANEACWIMVAYREVSTASYRFSMRYKCSVATRRYLSEFRDNCLARNDLLLSLASRLRNIVRRPK